MTAMTTTALPAGQWTTVLAATPTSCTLQNVGSCDLMIRIGTGVSTGDAMTAAHDVLRPGEHRSLTIASTDAVLAAPITNPVNPVAGLINVRA